MTNMKHKSADQRKMRRQRYKNACKPMMQLFGCTSMEVAVNVSSVVTENKSLKAKLIAADATIVEKTADIVKLKVQIEGLEEQIASFNVPLEVMRESAMSM